MRSSTIASGLAIMVLGIGRACAGDTDLYVPPVVPAVVTPHPAPPTSGLIFAGTWRLKSNCGFKFDETLVISEATRANVRGQTLMLLGNGAILNGHFDGKVATFTEQYPSDTGVMVQWTATLAPDGTISGQFVSSNSCTFTGKRER